MLLNLLHCCRCRRESEPHTKRERERLDWRVLQLYEPNDLSFCSLLIDRAMCSIPQLEFCVSISLATVYFTSVFGLWFLFDFRSYCTAIWQFKANISFFVLFYFQQIKNAAHMLFLIELLLLTCSPSKHLTYTGNTVNILESNLLFNWCIVYYSVEIFELRLFLENHLYQLNLHTNS